MHFKSTLLFLDTHFTTIISFFYKFLHPVFVSETGSGCVLISAHSKTLNENKNQTVDVFVNDCAVPWPVLCVKSYRTYDRLFIPFKSCTQSGDIPC